MKQIKQRRTEIAKKYHATGTTKVYQTAAKQWKQFCELYKIHKRQYTEANLCLFISWLDIKLEDGIKPATVKNKLYGIREFAYQTYGDILEVDNKTMTILARFRKGIAVHNPATNGSAPITLEMCKILIQTIDAQQIPEWIKQTQKTIIILAFSEIKRAGEYLIDYVTNRSFKHGNLTPRYHHATKQWYLDWKRKDGKTHREGSELNALHSALICKCNRWGNEMCPVHNTQKLMILKKIAGIPVGPNEHVFVYEEGGEIKPYNKYKAGHLLKRMVKEAGYPQGPNDPKYSLHGFRKGGAIQATKDGVPISTIMKQADWKSERMVHHYQRQINIDDHASNLINRYR